MPARLIVQGWHFLMRPAKQERKCLQLLICFSKNYSIWIHCILKALDPPYKAQKKHSKAEQEIFLKRVSSGCYNNFQNAFIHIR